MAAASSTPFFGIRDEHSQMTSHQHQQSSSATTTPSSSAATAPQSAAPAKKKRNLPGTPNPDAEVIALSPKTLMATNRFICEVCNKGFQREQNLQLHRRGHNLPWKLRQKSTKEVRRKVYLCPEPTCVHHDPSRALGDLTGIKKHFCRKHGEKKWKCEKCSKRYAVQSDWKAHSKTCGTREYRCDCGTLFSRRDSFITHRAFCDALAQESARLPTGLSSIGSHLYGTGSIGLGLSHVNSQLSSLQDQGHPSAELLRLGGSGGAGGSQFDHLLSPSNPSSFRPPSAAFYLGSGTTQDFNDDNQTKPFHGLMSLSDFQANPNSSAPSANLFNLSFFSSSSSASNSNNVGSQNAHLMMADHFSHGNGSNDSTTLFSGNAMSDHMGGPSLYNAPMHNETAIPQMSATALLQKAAQMGATTSTNSPLLRGFGSSTSSGGKAAASFRPGFGGGGGESFRSQMENETHLQDLMNSLANGTAGIFGGAAPFAANGGQEQETAFAGLNAGLCNMDEASKFQQSLSTGGLGGSDRLTRDFLGVGSMVRGIGGAISPREPHHGGGIDMGSLDPDMKSASSSRSFPGVNLQ